MRSRELTEVVRSEPRGPQDVARSIHGCGDAMPTGTLILEANRARAQELDAPACLDRWSRWRLDERAIAAHPSPRMRSGGDVGQLTVARK